MSVSGTPQSNTASHRAVTHSRAVFFTSVALAYAITIVAATLTLNAYFAQTWDVKTFIQAAHRFLDGGNPFDLYAASRTAQTWPYAYPPLHAFVTAIFLWAGNFVPVLPDYVWARVPGLIADIGVGMVLYVIVSRKSSDELLARAAMLLWLFNPVTFYDTAVQGHFESEWILFVMLAYFWLENSRGVVLPTIALAIAVLFKQIAILFVIPFWVMSLRGAERRGNLQGNTEIATPQKTRLAMTLISLALFALVTLAVCAPYLLYSNDFLYMNLTYVENVPVQTQSWVVALLALTRPAREAMTSDFFFLRYGTPIAMLAVLGISVFAARGGYGLWLTGALIAMAFFLTSRKVMGYYYVMLLPFLLAEFLPRRRFGIVLGAIVLTSYIALSPYFAPWGNPDHIWIYALLGTINSTLLGWMFVRMTEDERPMTDESASFLRPSLSVALFVSWGLFASGALAALMQPFAPNGGSPIRVPLIPPGAEPMVLAAFGALVALTLVALWALSRKLGRVPHAAWVGVLAFAPLFFTVYTLTKESTAVLEWLLQVLGV